MKRFLPALAAALLLAAPARALDSRTHLYDLAPETLDTGHSEFGLFWAKYSRGMAGNLQLGTHAVGDATGLLNGFAKYRFLARPELRASLEAGFVWAAVLMLGEGSGPKPLLLFVPVELRAAIPIDDRIELYLAWIYRAAITSGAGARFGTSSLRIDATLARYDTRGAWYLTGRFPLFARADMRLDALLGQTDVGGTITLDDLVSWGVLAGRDFTYGERGHLRLGLGYRNTPGILMYESLGHVLVNVDLYWR